MRIAVTGVASWCAADPPGADGSDRRPTTGGPAALLERLETGGHALSRAAPYPLEGLRGPRAGFIPGLPTRRRAQVLLEAVVQDALGQAGRPPGETGLLVGTSSGEIEDGRPHRHRPCVEIADTLGLTGPRATVSVACASGTAALAVAKGWLLEGAAAVVVAGVDALDLFVHAGFSGLGGLTADRPRPFAAGRDGLALGEGAAALVLEPLSRAEARGAVILAELTGVGLSCDARHMVAPHREGRGVADALRAGLADAGLPTDAVDLVSVHGTGTDYNDGMEARALRTVFGERPLSVHGVKHAIGHTLGAAGAIEAALLVHALQAQVEPRPIDAVDPELPWPPPASVRSPRVGLSTSSAFGGINACAIFSRYERSGGPTPPAVPRPVHALATVEVELPMGADLRALWPDAPPRALRLDPYCKVGVWAISEVLARCEVPPGCGVVLGTALGCVGADLVHHTRIVEEGAARASRLAFTYTVPSAPACEAAILHGLRGPLLTFVGAPDQTVEEASRLLRHGLADALIALTCEAEPGRSAIARATVLAGDS